MRFNAQLGPQRSNSPNDLHLLCPTVRRRLEALAGLVRFENKNDPAGVFSRSDLLELCDFATEERWLGLLLVKEDLPAFEGLGFVLRNHPVSALKQSRAWRERLDLRQLRVVSNEVN